MKLFSWQKWDFLETLWRLQWKFVWEDQDERMYNDHWSLVDSQCHLVVTWHREVAPLEVDKGAKTAKSMAQAFGPTQLSGSCFPWSIHSLKVFFFVCFFYWKQPIKFTIKRNNLKVKMWRKKKVFDVRVHKCFPDVILKWNDRSDDISHNVTVSFII